MQRSLQEQDYFPHHSYYFETAPLKLHCVLGEIQLRGEWFGQLIRNYNFKLFIVWFIYTPPIFGWLSPTIADYPGQGFTHFAWFVSQTIFCCLVLSYSHCSPNRSLPSFTFGKSYLEPVRNVEMSSGHWSVASYSKFYTYSWLYSFGQNLSCVLLVSLIPKLITPMPRSASGDTVHWLAYAFIKC